VFESVSGRPRHAGLETCATTICRANPKIAAMRDPRAKARVVAVDEASTAAR